MMFQELSDTSLPSLSDTEDDDVILLSEATDTPAVTRRINKSNIRSHVDTTPCVTRSVPLYQDEGSLY